MVEGKKKGKKYGHHNENVNADVAQYFTKILHKLRCLGRQCEGETIKWQL